MLDNHFIALATNLISYVVDINENRVLENETNYNALNELSKKINYTLPPFRKVTIDNEPLKTPSYEQPSLDDIIDDPSLARKLNAADLIDAVNLITYGENAKQLIVDIFYEARIIYYSCEDINKLIDRRALCYIKKSLDNYDSKVELIVDFIFNNWKDINIVARLSLVYNLCFSNQESLTLAKKYKDHIVGDNNILIATIGALIFKEEIVLDRVDLSAIESYVPVSEEVLNYFRCFSFNYHIISSFCQFFGIDESKILNYHMYNLKNNYQGFTDEFWSNYYNIFSNNTISYNSFLEAVDIVLIDSYYNHLVSLNDIYELSLMIADSNQIAFKQPTMPIMQRKDEILLAEFNSELIHDYETGAEQKVVYRVWGLQVDDKTIDIIHNNLEELDRGINYINQIRFYLLNDILTGLNWYYDILDGCEVIVDGNNNIIGRYITNKYGLLGLESCCDQTYRYQEGKLYITSNAFNELKTFFDTPNTSLFIEDSKTFIFRNKYKK